MSDSKTSQKNRNSIIDMSSTSHLEANAVNACNECGDNNRPMLALLQIGQSPQPNMESEFRYVLGDGWDIRSFGALDHLKQEKIVQHSPESDDDTLFTVLPPDDRPVLISKRRVIDGLRRRMKDLQKINPRVAILCCTGLFPEIDSPGVLKASEIIADAVHSQLNRGSRLGVFVPDRKQVADTIDYWCMEGFDAVVIPLSPEAPVETIDQAAHQMRELAPEALVYDCMIYTHAMIERVEAVCPAASILAVAAAANAARKYPGSKIKQYNSVAPIERDPIVY